MNSRILISLVALLLVAPVSAKQSQAPEKATLAAPTVTVINGTPLTIKIGSDNSYQVFNSDIPVGPDGAFGQFYPKNAPDTADVGWFVDVDGVLYAPNFNEHPGGTATGSLGAYTVFTESSLSGVGGSGTSGSPYVVEVISQLGDTGLSAIKTTEYVNGDGYYIERFRLINLGGGTQQAHIFYGGDIFLADSDAGVPYREPVSGSPGGQTCPGSDPYNILMIPLTPANAVTASGFSSVWSQIGDAALNNGTATGCIDNGAALQWNVTLPPNSSRIIQAATSFGAIPPIATFNITNVDPFQGSIGTQLDVAISGYGFLPATRFDFGIGISVQSQSVISPTSAQAHLVIAPDAALGFRDVVATQVPGGLSATLIRGFAVGEPPVWNYTVNGQGGVISAAAVTCIRSRFPANSSTNAQGWAPSEGEFYHEDPLNPFGPPAPPNGLARAVLDCFLSPSAWNANIGQLYEQYCWDEVSPRYIGEYPDIREIDLRIYFSLDFQCNGPPPGTPIFEAQVNIIRQLFSPLPMVRSGFEVP